jgi:branched-subunit amino acid ABC-type transport system permease component
MELIINQLFSGLVRSALYFLVTSGLTLLFGVVGTLNMSHFSLYMISSYVTWTFCNLLMDHEIAYWLAFFLCALTMCVFALIIEFLVMRQMYERQLGEQLLITFSLVFIFDDLTKTIWGSSPLFVTRPPILTGLAGWGNIHVPTSGIFVIILALIAGLSTWFVLARTRVGRISRAAYSHKIMLPVLGIPIQRVYMFMFVLSVLLASFAGVAWTVLGVVDLGQAHSLLIECFCVMVIGGMGSFPGTALSALICGLSYSFAILIVPKLATPFIFLLAGIVLLIRPWGLMGKVGRLH